jgi:nucleoside-diphosphate kinase
MNEPALVIIKPDGIKKQLVGDILAKFSRTGLDLVGMRIAKTSRDLAREHYKHLKRKPFFNEIVAYLAGEYHYVKRLIALVYYGRNAIARCREAAGATNPEEAAPQTIRGSYGRITTDGLFENVVHVSSTPREAEREIKLWFDPQEILVSLYPTKKAAAGTNGRKVWA